MEIIIKNDLKSRNPMPNNINQSIDNSYFKLVNLYSI